MFRKCRLCGTRNDVHRLKLDFRRPIVRADIGRHGTVRHRSFVFFQGPGHHLTNRRGDHGDRLCRRCFNLVVGYFRVGEFTNPRALIRGAPFPEGRRFLALNNIDRLGPRIYWHLPEAAARLCRFHLDCLSYNNLVEEYQRIIDRAEAARRAVPPPPPAPPPMFVPVGVPMLLVCVGCGRFGAMMSRWDLGDPPLCFYCYLYDPRFVHLREMREPPAVARAAGRAYGPPPPPRPRAPIPPPSIVVAPAPPPVPPAVPAPPDFPAVAPRPPADYPIIVVPAGEEPEDCPICTNPMNEYVQTECRPIGHKFHSHCLLGWREIRLTCPICRGPLLPVPP